MRLAGSTGANPYAAISAGVSALWGPAHGGANEAVLVDARADRHASSNIPKYLAMAKDKRSHFRLMGFGHRVYKNFDPRAKIIREMCHKVLAKLGRSDNPLFELALRLEEIALKDEYFVSRKLYPNVDFYSGHHLQRARHPALDVHGDVRDRAHRGLGGALAGDDRRSGHAHRPAAPALHRADAARLRRRRKRRLSAAHPRALSSDRLALGASSSASSSQASARRIGRPSTGLTGAWRMPSAGTPSPRSACSSSAKRTAGIDLDALGVELHAPLGHLVRDARDRAA